MMGKLTSAQTYAAQETAEPSKCELRKHIPTFRQPGEAPTEETDPFSFCQYILDELFDPKHKNYAHHFYQPVDVETLELHDYHAVIRKPMDLGTVRRKLEAGKYPNSKAFAADVRLIFRNCLRYNEDDSWIVRCACNTRHQFELLYAWMPEEPDSYTGFKRRSRRTKGSHGNSIETDSTNNWTDSQKESSPGTSEPNPKNDAPRERIYSYSNKQKISTKISIKQEKDIIQNDPKACVGLIPANEIKNEVFIKAELSEPEPEMSHAEKFDIAGRMHNLSAIQVRRVVAILRENEKHISDHSGDDVEVDMDRLKTSTLRAVKEYLNGVKSTSERKPLSLTIARKKNNSGGYCCTQNVTPPAGRNRKDIRNIERYANATSSSSSSSSSASSSSSSDSDSSD